MQHKLLLQASRARYLQLEVMVDLPLNGTTGPAPIMTP